MNAQETIEAGKLMVEYGEEWLRTGREPLNMQMRIKKGSWADVIPQWDWITYEYRRRPEPKLVPFGPEDITTAMQFRRKGTTDWFVPNSATTSGVHLFGHGLIKYDLLLADYECRHFNDTEWRPCGFVWTDRKIPVVPKTGRPITQEEIEDNS